MSNVMGATSWQSGGNIHLRVYSLAGGTLLERCWDTNSWYTGALTNNKYPSSTGAEATSWLDGSGAIHIRVYAVNNGKIMEYCWDGGGPWYVGALSNVYTASAAPGATSWVDSNGAMHIRVYAADANNVQREYCWDGNGPWYIGAYTE